MRSLMKLALVVVVSLPTASALAQTKGKSKTNSATKSTKKVSSETSCDGALDIVPSETLTFQRKRRPTALPTTSETSDKKTENKPNNPA